MINRTNIEKAVEMKNVILHALRQAKYLEKRLEETFNYIDPTLDNYKNTNSLAAKEIIVQACIQIEAVAKTYYNLFYKKSSRFDFNMWGKAFPTDSPEDIRLQSISVTFEPIKTLILPKPYGINISPWKHEPNKNPTWWTKSYNLIKHGDNKTLDPCTYENALLSIAGLYSMIIFTKEYSNIINIRADEFQPKYFGGISLKGIYK